MATWSRSVVCKFYLVRLLVYMVLLCSLVSAPPPAGPFECANGKMIRQSWLCDGTDDCGDGFRSDEQNCDDIQCDGSQFACEDGTQCVSGQHVCNDDFDCNDRSDEIHCSQRECQASEFNCSNGRCIHGSYRCDYDDDCGDGSDETNCSDPVADSNLFRCPNTSLFISESWRCDRIPDCPHGYDEILNCDRYDDCDRFGMVNCSSGGCVKASVVCDGGNDCPDGSDEVCPKRECDLTTEFECYHTAVGLECLSRDWLCDGEVDCYDATGSDEFNCIAVCTETEFPCVTGGQCVPNLAQCDGTHDCRDGSDEYSCDRNTVPIPCHSGFFQCHNGECVGDSQLCDGGQDCEDGTDEDPMWCTVSGSGDGTICTGDSHGCEHYCNDTSHAYHCSCYPGHVLDDDRKKCSDINECEDRSKCSQLCCNTPGSYECRCVAGFDLQKDGSCKPTGARGYLLLLDKVDISSFQYGSHSARKVVRDLAQAFAIDYHFRLKRLYWSELTYQGAVIKCAPLVNRVDVDNITVVIDTGLTSPHGLAVDWISNKIYWTDITRSHLSVAELDGSKRTVLFSSDMRKPRGIALDPTTGYMYWTDWGDRPRIERASMDGKDRTVLHSTNLVWPNALTIDYTTQTLYWIDAKLDYIESSFRDGTQRQVLYRENNVHFRPFGLTFFRDRLYMADIEAREVRSFLVKSNKSVLSTIYSDGLEPMSVVAVDETRQPYVRVECLPKAGNFSCDCENITVPVTNPCEVDNGGCEYMCLLGATDDGGSYSCACPTGHRLHPDGTSCCGLDTFLVLVDRSDAYTISLDVPHPVNVRFPLPGVGILSAVAWDSRDDTLYFADLNRRTISATKFNGGKKRLIVDSSTLKAPVGLALDWLHDRLYWTDSERDTIESCDLDGGRRAIIVYSGLDQPRDVALDPERGLMFWSDWSDRRPRIMRAALDGTSKLALVTERIDTPNGVALDYQNQIVYWVDGVTDTIEMVHYDGSNRVTLIDFNLDYHPSGLDFYGGRLYWTNWREHNLMGVNVTITNLGEPEVMVREIIQSRDVTVFHRNRNHSAYTPCKRNNGGCSNICVSRARISSGVKAGCLCEVGFPLLEDGKTCATEINTTMLFPTANAIHFVSQDVDDYTADVVVPVDVAAQTITSVTMDPINGVIYYATLDTFGIHRVNLTGENQTSILDEHPTAITSLEVDYASQNVYFVDSYENRLEVASSDGRRRRVLHDGLVSPTGLALDPVSLTLFYIDAGDRDRNESPKIYSAAMDGSSPEVIVTGFPLNRPLYIAIDNSDGVDGKIFWTDAGTNAVYRASLLGEDPEPIAGFGPSDVGSIVHGIAFFGEHVFFTDSGLRKIYKSTTILMDKSVYMEGFNYLSDIKIVETRKGQIRGCLNMSRCDYLCLPNPNVPSKQTCACATGIEPSPDGSCPEVPKTFLLVAGQNSLRRIALDNPSGEYVDIPLYDSLDGYDVNAVDYLLTARGEGYIYIAEMRSPSGIAGDNVWRSRIRRQRMFDRNGNGSEIIHEEDTGIIEDIAVDWTTGNVYFTLHAIGDGRTQSHVAMVSGRGAGNKVTLVNTTLHKPRGIALHPLQNTMFWTDFGDTPKVETARMNGMSRTPIITRDQMPFSNLRYPNDVVVDLNTDLVYFCDGGAGIIGATTFLGNTGEIIVAADDNPDLRRSQPAKNFIRKPWSLTMRHFSPSDRDSDPETEETELFWSDPEFHLMSSASLVTTGRLTTGIEKTHLRNILERTTQYKPLAVQFVSIDGHKPGEITGLSTMPCSTNSCEYLCLNINVTHFQCLCPDSVPNCRPRIQPTERPTRLTPTNPPPETPPTTSSSSQPGHSDTSPPPPSSPSDTDSTRSGTGTEPGQGHSDGQGQSDEQTGNQEEESSLRDLGVGLGTVLVVVFVLFVAFVVGILYLSQRVRRKNDQVDRAAAILGSETPLRSLSAPTSPRSPSSPSPPTHTKKTDVFRLPTKQCNFIRNNLSPVATQSSIPLKCVANPSTGVNEFVDEPEVYPVSPKRVKKQTKALHEKVALTKYDLQEVDDVDSKLCCENDVSDDLGVGKKSSDSYSSNVTVSATIEIEIEDLETTAAEEEDTHKKKPSRTCLSSDSDSSQEKSRRGLSVSWEVSQPHPPPPPLPPRENNEEVETPPPRPPKPLLPCNESDHKERGGEETGSVISGEDGDSRQVLEQNAVESGDHGNKEQVSPGVGEV